MEADSLPETQRRPTLLHRLEQAALLSLVGLTSLLGTERSIKLGAALATLGYAPFRLRRQVAESNLRMAFPEKDTAWIRRTARAAYAHLGREVLATLRLPYMSRAEILDNINITNFDVLQNAARENNGGIIVTGHVGTHEIAAAAMVLHGFPLDLVVQRQGNPLFDRLLNDTRKRFGVGVIDRAHARRFVMRSLKQRRFVAFAADQNAGRSGLFVPYFGRLASTHRGPALFAVRAGVPLILAAFLRRPGGYDAYLERIDVDRTGDLDDVVYRLTAAFTARLEEVVRAHPDQYLWLHRRWKTRPPEEPKGA